MLSFQTKEVSEMKNKLFIAMMMMASLLFIATGASAQYCPTCGYQGAAGITAHQSNEELTPAASGEQTRTQEFMPAVPATQEGSEQMVAAGAAGVTGEKDAHENSARFTNGRELCGYCSVFERGGFP
jgi:hypothetical protein